VGSDVTRSFETARIHHAYRRRSGGCVSASAVGAAGCFLDMLGVFAEFETNLRRER
jgi:hypothetical protein